MNMNNFIFKIIVTISLLPTLGALTNCNSKAAGSTATDNTNNKFVNSLPSMDKTPIENANKIETLPADLSKIPTVTYCELVQNASEYDHKIVRLRAIYFTAFEKTYFYDSRCEKDSAPDAPENVPAEMWAQRDTSLVSNGDSDEAKINRQLNGFGRKDVTVVGRFNSTDERNDPTQPNRFGHMNCCRFQFLIMRAESIINLDGKTAEAPNSYGKTVKFTLYKKLEFADFTLEYAGDFEVRSVAPHAPKELLPKHSFRISRADKTLVVWINEDRKNVPLNFEFGGAKFQLETGIYDESGKLAKDELIVRKIN